MNEQKLARLVLECHRRGYSIRHHMREMRTQHIASLASGAFGLALLQAADCDTLMWIVLGTGIGLFLRDAMWFQAVKKGWPFNEKIIDWNKVEAIAQSDGPSPEDGGSPDAVR